MVTAHIKGGISIRKGPGQVYDRIGPGLKDGERAAILGVASRLGRIWYYVDPENPGSSSGWIAADITGLQVEGDVNHLPPHPYPAPPEPTATASPVPLETPTATL